LQLQSGDLWSQLAHPVTQQDREEHDEQTEGNIGCIHKRPLQVNDGQIWLSNAEKPKMGERQMDWLRSEDLKEEKNVTAPIIIITVKALCRGVPFLISVVMAAALAAVGTSGRYRGRFG